MDTYGSKWIPGILVGFIVDSRVLPCIAVGYGLEQTGRMDFDCVTRSMAVRIIDIGLDAGH